MSNTETEEIMNMNNKMVNKLKNEVDDDLRLIVHHNSDEYDTDPTAKDQPHEILFEHDDLDPEYRENTLNSLINEIRMREFSNVFDERGRGYIGWLTPYGEHRCSVEVLDDGVLLLIMSWMDNFFVLIDRPNDVDLFNLVDDLNEIVR